MQINYRIDSSEVEAALRQAPAAMQGALGAALDRSAIEVSRLARRLAPKATSLLTNSITWRRTGPLEREVTAGAQYAAAVERGSSPGGMPPVQSIRDWVRAAGVRPRDARMDEDDLAYLIARSIRFRGTRAQPFMEPARRQSERRVQRLLAAGVATGLRRAGL